jgi:hypothetical protein
VAASVFSRTRPGAQHRHELDHAEV